jgi:hypothetical protein
MQPHHPAPTADALNATVYSIAFTSPQGTTRTSFSVLALSHDQAKDFAHYRLHSMYPDVGGLTLDRCAEMPTASWEFIQGVLDVETDIERDERRAWWKRQEDGPSEPDYNGTSAAEIIERGYRALMERRR